MKKIVNEFFIYSFLKLIIINKNIVNNFFNIKFSLSKLATSVYSGKVLTQNFSI